jgi:hypothetical protein
MKNLKKILGKNAHWQLNKVLVRNLGLTETLVLQHLIDLEGAFNKEEIFQPIPEMSLELGVTEYSIKQAIGTLKTKGLVNVERKRIGYMNWYSVNKDNVLEFIENSDNSPVSKKSTHQPVVDMKSTLSDTETDITVTTNPTLGEYENNSLSVENDIANTNNTTNNTLPKNTIKNTDTKEADKRLTKIIELMNSDYPSARKLLLDLEEDYKSLDNCLAIAYPNDTSAQSKWKTYLFNLKIN